MTYPVLNLAADEERDFLGGLLPPEAAAWPRCRPALGNAELLDTLARTRAPILVTAWATRDLPVDLRARCPDLRYICHLTGTMRGKIPRDLIEQGLLVTNWGGSSAPTVAEHALLLTLACLRDLASHQANLHGSGWHGQGGNRSLYERRVGLHGFGMVARALVPLLVPFRCRLAAFAPGDADSDLAGLGVARAASPEELYAGSDIVICLVPLTPRTQGLVGESLFSRLRDGAVFVNVGRGKVLDETALLRHAPRLAIGLDVYGEEPLPVGSPLRSLAHAVLTPHIAGPTVDRRCDAGAFCLANIRRFLAGEPPQAVIDLPRYDQQT
jgi:phosphoglycerate dehydrogenase-like enzyme